MYLKRPLLAHIHMYQIPILKQVICCGVVIMGIFISAAPTIFSLKLRDDDTNSSVDFNMTIHDAPPQISQPFLWPTLMILAQIPVAINYVIYETSKENLQDSNM